MAAATRTDAINQFRKASFLINKEQKYLEYFTFGTLKKTSKINWPSIYNFTEYDIHSIMHYDGTLRGHFTKPIMTDKITGKGIAINREMSPLDIQKLNKLYPCKSADGCGKFFMSFHFCHRIFLNFASI